MNTYFPMKIEIQETVKGYQRGQVLIVEWEEVPNGVGFKVLETNVSNGIE